MGAKGTCKSSVVDNKKLMDEWDYKRNSLVGFEPESTSLHSKHKVFWICSVGHNWEASVHSRHNKGSGCPKCAIVSRTITRRMSTIKRQGSLIDTHPDIAEEWHPYKNGDLTPKQNSSGCNDKAWWICKQCGNEWAASISNRTKGTGCPVCSVKQGAKKHRANIVKTSGSLMEKYPEIANEWHPTKNGLKSPKDYPPMSSEKVWWLCGKCGNEWETRISKRTRNTGCPICSKRKFEHSYRKGILEKIDSLVNLYPDIVEEWHPTKNEGLNPESFSCGSGKLIWWKCSNGHEWQSKISTRVKYKTGCPICSGRVVDKGFNDIVTTHPEIAEEWHPTKNGNLKPYDFKIGSDRIVWWKCECGHEWESDVKYLTKKRKCPACAKKFTNDLAIDFKNKTVYCKIK